MTARKQFPVLTLALLVLFLTTACRSAQKFVESGDYDSAINYCVSKLQGKKKKKTELVQGLEAAFAKAQNRDFDAIKHLDAENRPENWERVHAIHRQIANRQSKVEPLLPLYSADDYRADFELVDIAKLETRSRENAAEYLYGQAKDLLRQAKTGDKMAARKAYAELLDLQRRYFSEYKEKDHLLAEAKRLGTSYVLFEVKNQSDKILPRSFSEKVLAISKQDLDSEWKSFWFEPGAEVTFDYKVVFNVQQVDISPERVREREYTDEREVEDGWDYVLDSRGNVKKDSLGNDIKVKRFAKIRAQVLEAFQTKSARLTGQLEIFNADKSALLDSRRLGTEVIFEHYASTFRGDARALSDESRRCTGNSPKPFPMDEDLLVQAAEKLKPGLRDELRQCRAIL